LCVDSGDREQMLDNLYRAWKEDTDPGKTSLMIAGDLGIVNELNARARVDRVASGEVDEEGQPVSVGGRRAWVTLW
jgi:hypothetical protein